MSENQYTQLCVWPGCVVGIEKQAEFTEFMKREFNIRVVYSEEIITKENVDGEGGRNDLFFYVHSNDIPLFAVPRLDYGISWWEDVRGRSHSLYPNEVFKKYPKTW